MASSVVNSVVQQLGNLSVEEAKYLYKVRGRIESLQIELEWMECFLRDADKRQYQERVICKWVSQVRDLAYDAEDIIQRYLYEVSHHQKDGVLNTLKWFSCIIGKCDAWTLHCLGSEIDDLIIKISELTLRLQRYGIQQIINPNSSLDYNTMVRGESLDYNNMVSEEREERRNYSHIVEDVVGLTTDVNKVVSVLLQNDHNFIGISGTGGLGKTALARKVFQHIDVRNHFKNNCVWVYISKEFEKNNLFREILIGLDKGEDAKKRIKDLNAEDLPKKIQELLQTKKCFVVLDGISNVKDWESIKLAFESTKGSPSKILLTTRNRSLLEHVDPSGYDHPLNLLSDDDGWKLLKLKAFTKYGSTGGGSSVESSEENEPQDDEVVDLHTSMEKLGRKMLKHCKRLPLVIVVLGGILSTKKTLSAWEDVHKYISSYLRSDMEEGGRNNLAVLELSYHDLPFNLKPCFLYLCNFPKDYEISTHRLYRLWQAEGLLVIEGGAEKQRGSIYNIGEMYLNELVQRSMVQVGMRRVSGRIKSCRVHDVMRDLCLRKCEEMGFLNIIECTKKDMQSMMATSAIENYKLRRCALHVKDDLATDKHSGQHGVKFACLRSLLVFPMEAYTAIEMSQKMLKSFALIRILYLENSNIHSIDGAEHLIHLRYLCLRHTYVRKLPRRFYDLKYLETLDLRIWGNMELLNKFHKMKRLIHLYLPRECKVKGGERLSFLASQMETVKNFNPEKCETKDLMQMTNMRVFSIQKNYSFTNKDVLKEVLKEVLKSPMMINPGQLINSFCLKINAATISEEEPALRRLARHPNFNKLCLVGRLGSKYEHNVHVLLVNGLTHVTLIKCDIGEAGILSLGKLPNLQELHIIGPAVEGNKMTFSAGSFQQLKDLHIINQEDLEEWEVGYAALPNLRTLYIEKCAKLSKLPDGLPLSVNIECYEPCIKGIENYNTCPHYEGELASS